VRTTGAVLGRWFHAVAAVRVERWLLLAVGLLLVYFAYHAVSGSRGLVAVLELKREIRATEAELDRLIEERITLEGQVKRLRAESLDLDLLDERARATLGLIHEDEVIVFTGEEGLRGE
jgi:cell division protein FtsB